MVLEIGAKDAYLNVESTKSQNSKEKIEIHDHIQYKTYDPSGVGGHLIRV
jgi:hypothetical protein